MGRLAVLGGSDSLPSREDWIGRTGREWALHGAALERLLGPAGAAGLGVLAARPGEEVLDLGCGRGLSTEALAGAVRPGGRVTGIDVSPDLAAEARTLLADVDNAEIVEADAALHRFDRSFDALYSRFASMFFDDPAAACAHLAGGLKPGGRAVFVCWREAARNQWASVPMTFSLDGVESAPPTGSGPFAWANPAVFRTVLSGAGFVDVRESTFEYMAEIGTGDDPDPLTRATEFMLCIGPLAQRLRGAPDAARAEAERFLRARLARHLRDGAVRLLASAWIVEARKPG